MAVKHEVIFCIVNAGYSPLVMDSARQAGAQGGTVIRARGTANRQAEIYFNIPVQPEKEIVMILVPATIKDAVLHALYRNVGLNTAGQGIAFSVPATHVVGLNTAQQPIRRKSAPVPENYLQSENTPTARQVGVNQTLSGETPRNDGAKL